jgi:hypothetical protein
VRFIECALIATTLLHVARAEAQESPRTVLLDVGECPGAIEATEFVERVRIELTTDAIEAVRVGSQPDAEADLHELAVLRVEAAPCAPDTTTFLLRVDDLLTQKHVERTIDVSGVALEARPRTIALALAELLRASWSELAFVEPPPEVPAEILTAVRLRAAPARDAQALGAPAAAAAPPDPPPAPPTPRPSLGASFLVHDFPSGRVAPIGGRIALEIVPLRELVVRIEGDAAVGSALDPLGRVDLGLADLALVVAYALLLHERVTLTIGPRVAGGVGWASGHPYAATTSAGSGFGAIVSVGAALTLAVTIADPLVLSFGASGEGMILGFDALVGGVPVAGIAGGSISAWSGLSVLL